MKKRYRYSIFIASAILACTPIAISNLSNNSQVVKADVQPNGNGSDSGQSGKGNTPAPAPATNQHPTPAPSPEGKEDKPYKLSDQLDDMSTNIKWNKDLTEEDLISYFRQNAHFKIDDTVKTDAKMSAPDVYVTNDKGQNVNLSTAGHDVSMLLEPGYKVKMRLVPRQLSANTWYSWTMTPDDWGNTYSVSEDLPADIQNRIVEKNGSLIEKTGPDGYLPTKDIGQNKYEFLGEGNFGQSITFTISQNADATSITHNTNIIGKPADVIGGVPVVPNGSNNGQNADSDFNNDVDSNSTNWNSAPTNNGTGFNVSSIASNSDDQNTNDNETKNNKQSSKTKNLVLTHNAFVYDKNGKVISKHSSYRMKRLFGKVHVLDHGKKYRIRGQWYYRIGKDQYIKVSNVGVITNKVQKVNTRGTIQASKKYGVKLYSANGKYLKKFLTKSKKVKFDKKKFMKRNIFYRIKGTKIWVRAANINLVKGSHK